MIPNPITHKLLEWLDATTSYNAEPKEDLKRKPNHERPPKWRSFYSYGPILVMDESSSTYKLAVAAVANNQGVRAGETITSGNGRKYVVQPNGSIRKV